MNTLSWIALVLLIVGGLNWGMIGLFQFDIVMALLGTWPVLVRIVYVLVGLSAFYIIFSRPKEEEIV